MEMQAQSCHTYRINTKYSNIGAGTWPDATLAHTYIFRPICMDQYKVRIDRSCFFFLLLCEKKYLTMKA